MAKMSISMDDAVYERMEAIREAMQEQDPLGRKPPRSVCIEAAVKDWNDTHAHYLEDDGAGTGNPFLTLANPTA